MKVQILLRKREQYPTKRENEAAFTQIYTVDQHEGSNPSSKERTISYQKRE
jgi:hypothetical protein